MDFSFKMSKAETEMVEAYDTANKCLQKLCRKEYKGYGEFIKALSANATLDMMRKNPAMEELLKCKVDKCKKAVIVLIQKSIVANTENIKKDTLQLKQQDKQLNAFQKKILKDSIQKDTHNLAVLQKIDLNQVSWQELMELK